jgi:hypothetical protein
MRLSKTRWFVILAGAAAALFFVLMDRLGIGRNPDRFGYIQAGLLVVIGILTVVTTIFADRIFKFVRSIPRQVKKAGPAEIGMSVGALALTLIVLELAVRMMGSIDADGQFYFRDRPIRPYTIPVSHVESILAEYAARTDTYQIYDPLLGWTIRPNAESENGLYRSNANGLRADRDFPLEADPQVFRIALFGDSFTHGDDVPLEDSWAYLLEQLLLDSGYPVEILNFGEMGYGMDQAYLRWHYEGRDYQPDLVIFGFQPENMNRNLNIARPILFPDSAIPFFKPRFVLENGQLDLVDSPTPPPEDIPALLRDFGDSDLAQFETYYGSDYEHHWWQASRLASVIIDTVFPPEAATGGLPSADTLQLDSEKVQLSIAILQTFQTEVLDEGAQFMILHLPPYRYMAAYGRTGQMPHHEMLDALDADMTLVRTEDALSEADLDGTYVHRGHYSAAGNQIVAGEAGSAVEMLLER